MGDGFIYDHFVTGKAFLGRKKDIAILSNLLSNGDSVAVYDEPGTGKMSLIQQVLTNLCLDNSYFTVAEISFLKARTLDDVLCEFVDGVVKASASSPSEYRNIFLNCLQGTHFVFDQALYDVHGRIASTNWLLDEIDVRKALELPSVLTAKRGGRLVVLIDEFQNVLFPEESRMLLTEWEKIICRHDDNCPFIFTGSRLNGMREIFDIRRWFWRSVVRFTPERIPIQDIADYVYRIFMNQGKVVEKELVALNADVLRCNLRQINHLFSIVDHIARGYVNEKYMAEAMDVLLSIHRPYFHAIMCSLTNFQLNLLKAILDGEVKFSSSAVIDHYGLSSSANVKRLKDALVKKEIIWFDDKDVPHIQDPLFEVWLHKIYFAD